MKIEEYVKLYDPTLQFEVLKKSWEQIEYAQNLSIKITSAGRQINSIIITGMGGSAISADLIKNFLKEEIKIPYIVNRSYTLPSFAGENTLLIVSSYSGNTEESISVFNEAIKRNCSIICITTGGEIKRIAEEKGIPYFLLLTGYQPRYALGQSFFTLLKILEAAGVIRNQDASVNEIMKLWKEKGEEYTSEENEAMIYAQRLTGFIPVIYSAADYTDAAGTRFKGQLNENSKVHAFHNIIPEMNHNEIIGWESYNQKDFRVKVINLMDRDYPKQIKRRFEVTSALITAKDVEIINLESSRNSFKVRLFDLIYLFDWITYYLAVIRGFDPVEIEYINRLKSSLTE
jgi:glucose/mannose-6-phosphate isomerase